MSKVCIGERVQSPVVEGRIWWGVCVKKFHPFLCPPPTNQSLPPELIKKRCLWLGQWRNGGVCFFFSLKKIISFCFSMTTNLLYWMIDRPWLCYRYGILCWSSLRWWCCSVGSTSSTPSLLWPWSLSSPWQWAQSSYWTPRASIILQSKVKKGTEDIFLLIHLFLLPI